MPIGYTRPVLRKGRCLLLEANLSLGNTAQLTPLTQMYGPAVRRKRFSSICRFEVSHQCIRPLIGACAPGHHGYQRDCVLISGPASSGPFGSPGFACAGKTDPPSLLILSQTSAGNGIVISSSLAPYRSSSFVRAKRPFLRPGLPLISGAARRGRQPDHSGSILHLPQRGLRPQYVSGIDKHGHALGFGRQLVQQPKPLWHRLVREKIHSCQVTARPREARDQAKPDRVVTDAEHDRDRRGLSFCCERSGRVAERSDRRHATTNFLHGLELTDFSTIHAAAQVWLDTIANVRIHGETQQRPVDLFAQERPHLGTPNPNPYDLAHTSTSIASSQSRITLDTNQYSVPAAYAHRRLTVKAYPDRVCIYFDNQLIARHTRCYGRHEDIEEPDHAKGLIAQRSRAREQRLMMHFLALSPDATAYYDGLEQRRFNARHHVRKILALAEIYPADAVARAISDGLAFQAFSAEYITNILETRARALPEPGPLQLTRRHDLLDIDIAPPDLNAYEVNDHDPE